MSATKTDQNPFLRRSRPRRAYDGLKAVKTLPRMAYHTVRSWPLLVRQLIIGIGVVALLWGGYVAVKLGKRSRDRAVMAELTAIDNIVATTNDRDAIIKSLDAILAINPDDMLAKSRRAAVESGRIDPTDPAMIRVILRHHQKNNDLDAVIREGERRLETEKRDYSIHAMLATAYYQKTAQANDAKRKAEAASDATAAKAADADVKKHYDAFMRELDAIANPNANSVNLDFNSMVNALELLRHFKPTNLNAIRDLLATRALPMLKAEQFQKADPGTQSTLVLLYSEVFELPNVPLNAAEHWPAAARMMELCLEGCREKDDTASALRLAGLGEKLSNALTRMRSAQQLTDVQRAEAAKELEDRIRRAWTMVLAKEPKNAAAHIGLVQSYFRSQMNAEGYNALVQGIEIVGDQPQLLQMLTNISILFKNPMAGYQRMMQAAERNPAQPTYLTMAARAAYAADRRDLATKALEAARKISPDDLNIAAMQAALYTGTNHPHLVLKALADISDEKLLTTIPGAVPSFTRALAEIGDEERLEAFFKLARELGAKVNSPEPAYLAALGVHQADNPTTARGKLVAEFLGGIVERWRNELPAAAAVHALALARACETAEGVIDPAESRKAVIALERAHQQDVNNATITAALADLRLRGDNFPQQALQDIEPLVAKLEDLGLTGAQAEIVGRVYNANKKYDDAIRVLTRYTASRPTAGALTQLGLAYYGQGRPAEAKGALDRASGFTMSDRERAEYKSARVLLTREKQ